MLEFAKIAKQEASSNKLVPQLISADNKAVVVSVHMNGVCAINKPVNAFSKSQNDLTTPCGHFKTM